MKIQIPTNCPCCQYPLERVNDQLFCRNKECPAQLFKRVEHFAKVLGIKGLGPKTIEKLKLADITEIFYLCKEEVAEVLGDKVAENLLTEIHKARQAPLHLIISSFSIPLVGDTASRKVCGIAKHVDDITIELCKEAGLGDKATNNLITFLEGEFKEMREFLPFSFEAEKTSNKTEGGLTVCITGKLLSFKTKAQAHAALIALGYTPVGSVTKTLDILVDESGKGSDKRKKAEQYGIQIVTNLNDFINNH